MAIDQKSLEAGARADYEWWRTKLSRVPVCPWEELNPQSEADMLVRAHYLARAQVSIEAFIGAEREAGRAMMPVETEFALLPLVTLCDALEADGPRGTWVGSELDDFTHEYTLSSMRAKRTIELTDDFVVISAHNEYPGAQASSPLTMWDLRLARKIIGDRYKELAEAGCAWFSARAREVSQRGGG